MDAVLGSIALIVILAAAAGWFKWRGDRRPLGKFRVTQPIDALRLFDFVWQGRHALQKLIEREQIEFVLACWAVPAGFIASLLDVPYAVWSLGSDIHTSPRNPLTRLFVLRALRRASLRYANSLVLTQSVQQLTGLDCNLLPYLHPLPTDNPPANLPHDRPNLLVAARFEHVKGIDLLLDALAQIDPPRPRVHLAGAGTWENALRVQVARLNLQGDVVFLGLLGEGALSSTLRACDAVVIPSRDESLPSIFVESVRLGVPVVATDVGDLGALINQFKVGIVVPPNDPRMLAQAMITINRTPREQFTAHLNELAEQFDLTRSAKTLLHDLEGMLGRG